jgi:hypothetical protein
MTWIGLQQDLRPQVCNTRSGEPKPQDRRARLPWDWDSRGFR